MSPEEWELRLKSHEAIIAKMQTRERAELSPYSRVYFIQEESIEAIKIGTSTNVQNRVYTIGVNTPHRVKPLATMYGGSSTERMLHSLFDHARIHKRREWFRPEPELLRFVASLPDIKTAEKEAIFEKRRKIRIIS